MVKSLLKKPSLHPKNLNNFRQFSTFTFLDKLLKCMEASKFLKFLEETYFLQLSFRSGSETEAALVNDLRRAMIIELPDDLG